MCDEEAERELGLSDGKEQETPQDEDPEDILESLRDLFYEQDEPEAVVYGPLGHPFYTVSCPFAWPNLPFIDEFASLESVKGCVYLSKEGLKWDMFCFNVHFAWVNARMGMLQVALEQLEVCEEELHESDDDFYVDIMDGLTHCIQASRAHIYFLKGDVEMADEAIAKVFPLEEMNGPSIAALIAVHASVMGDFNRPHREVALDMMRKAIKLDPDDQGKRRGLWYHKVGKMLGELRRMDHRAGMPSREELEMLERATKVNPLPRSLAALADAYREYVEHMKVSNSWRRTKEEYAKMLSTAEHVYKKAYEMDSDDLQVLRRCGNGLMKLPSAYKDIPFAKTCLEKAIQAYPLSASALQALGTLEDRYNKNPKEALKYYKKSYENGNQISALFILEAEMKTKENYDPLPHIDEFIGNLGTVGMPLRSELLVLKGEYALFHRNDLISAAKFWKEAMSLGPTSEYITNHITRFLMEKRYEKPYMRFAGRRFTFNVCDCLRHEIRNALRESKYSSEDEVFLKEMENYLRKICR
ncbi:uncharacterized protein LOC124161587 isoform X2 [Ischnura elegans]|uniref:uncharacterized protein LOC124161587 isoform X2 n=1 Tax=Ischnura elegans TaxID=197161 RepID=UPI001ED8747A|nr:uncharacterized protein LOC124161587 isoform X2 [Ischnura elegans]